MSIIELKAKAYDIFANIEQLQRMLAEVNRQIGVEQNKERTTEKKDVNNI